MYDAFVLYFVNPVSDELNIFIQIARWTAPLATASGIIYIVQRLWKNLSWRINCLSGDCVEVYSDADIEVNMDEENQIQMYPNPAKEVLYINMEQASGGQVTVQITDLSGKEILSLQQQTQAGSSSIPVQISALSSGIYLVQVHTEAGMRYISKLTKE